MALSTRASSPSFSRSFGVLLELLEEKACSWKGTPRASATRGPMYSGAGSIRLEQGHDRRPRPLPVSDEVGHRASFAEGRA